MSPEAAAPASRTRVDRLVLVATIVLAVLVVAAIVLGFVVAWSPSMEPIRIETRPSA